MNDGPGFLVNRILMPYLGEALTMLEEGSRIEEIDHALLMFGMPMGAFILLDEIGIDIAHKVSGILHAGPGRTDNNRRLSWRRLYKEGFLREEERKGLLPVPARDARRRQPPRIQRGCRKQKDNAGWLPEQEIVERAVFLMIKEAALCLEEKIIDRVDHLDAALIFGIGFPPFRGGLMQVRGKPGRKVHRRAARVLRGKVRRAVRPAQVPLRDVA